MPKFFYFLVNFGLLVPLFYFNYEKLRKNLVFTIIYILITIVTWLCYFRAALSDPGYINSIMFNKAY